MTTLDRTDMDYNTAIYAAIACKPCTLTHLDTNISRWVIWRRDALDLTVDWMAGWLLRRCGCGPGGAAAARGRQGLLRRRTLPGRLQRLNPLRLRCRRLPERLAGPRVLHAAQREGARWPLEWEAEPQARARPRPQARGVMLLWAASADRCLCLLSIRPRGQRLGDGGGGAVGEQSPSLRHVVGPCTAPTTSLEQQIEAHQPLAIVSSSMPRDRAPRFVDRTHRTGRAASRAASS